MDCNIGSNLDHIIHRVFVIRFIIMCILFHYSTNIYHIYTLLLLDSIKGIPIRSSCIDHPPVAKSQTYQFWDKILDFLGYIMALEIIKREKLMESTLIKNLGFILCFRFIGTFLYLITNNRKFLFFFPDIFKETLFVYANNIDHNYLIVISLFKLFIEYRLHFTMEGTNILKHLIK